MSDPTDKGNGLSTSEMFTVAACGNGDVAIERRRTCIGLRVMYLQHWQGARNAVVFMKRLSGRRP